MIGLSICFKMKKLIKQTLKNKFIKKFSNISTLTPNEFISLLEKNKLKKGYATFLDGKLKSSHEIFEEVGKYAMDNKRDFYNHEVILILIIRLFFFK
jgi:hypothetical protein